MDTSTIQNHQEKLVYAAVRDQAQHMPHLGPDALADIACVALNRLPPRYIRHEVDMAFFQTEHERTECERAVLETVEYAFGFVQARNAMRARK